jgi:NADPH2:quinone reductase
MKPPLPFVPGSEYAGTVEAVGAGVKHLKVGDAVAAFGGTGGFATHAVVDAALVMPLPPGFAFDDAAAFILTYATTHHALVDRGQLKAGETLLVLGAAGGVGTAAIQIGKVLGARVIAASSSDEKGALCRSIGADETINYATGNIRDRLKELTGGKGPTSSTTRSAATSPSRCSARSDGAGAISSSASRRGRSRRCRSTSHCSRAHRSSASSGASSPAASRRRTRRARRARPLVREGKVKPVIDRRMPMRELPAAYERWARARSAASS